MSLGKRFGKDILNIYDTGLGDGNRGISAYDDEGVPTEKTYLIKEGVLVGRLHSRESAAKMGEKLTGSARALDSRFTAPIALACSQAAITLSLRLSSVLNDTKPQPPSINALTLPP